MAGEANAYWISEHTARLEMVEQGLRDMNGCLVDTIPRARAAAHDAWQAIERRFGPRPGLRPACLEGDPLRHLPQVSRSVNALLEFLYRYDPDTT